MTGNDENWNFLSVATSYALLKLVSTFHKPRLIGLWLRKFTFSNLCVYCFALMCTWGQMKCRKIKFFGFRIEFLAFWCQFVYYNKLNSWVLKLKLCPPGMIWWQKLDYKVLDCIFLLFLAQDTFESEPMSLKKSNFCTFEIKFLIKIEFLANPVFAKTPQ